ncbi:MAG TPA: hypothetical protein VHD90_12590 [Phototrophicaceae bacterium]|nr:hypothetical protein [Phototrophicaceae bacterium]
MSTPENDNSAECIAPPALSDEVLLAVLDGDPHSRQIDEHLDQCAYCRARLESMRMDEQALLNGLYRVDCPPADRLADYVMGSLMTSERMELEAHLQRCALCQSEVASLRAMLQVDTEPSAEQSPQEPVWGQMKDFFHALEDQLVRVLAPLPKTAYGQLKGSAHNRLLSYGGDALSVMLSVEKVIDGLKINGSIIDTEGQNDWNEGLVELKGIDANQARYIAVIDEDETFTFENVKPGSFHLSIFATNREILRLPQIELMP